MQKCQVVVATTGVPGLASSPEWCSKARVIFGPSNPFPEISIADAINAGAAFASDGSRVNNLIGYPGICGSGHRQPRHPNHLRRRMWPQPSPSCISLRAGIGSLDPLDPMVHAAVAKGRRQGGDPPQGHRRETPAKIRPMYNSPLAVLSEY